MNLPGEPDEQKKKNLLEKQQNVILTHRKN